MTTTWSSSERMAWSTCQPLCRCGSVYDILRTPRVGPRGLTTATTQHQLRGSRVLTTTSSTQHQLQDLQCSPFLGSFMLPSDSVQYCSDCVSCRFPPGMPNRNHYCYQNHASWNLYSSPIRATQSLLGSPMACCVSKGRHFWYHTCYNMLEHAPNSTHKVLERDWYGDDPTQSHN